MIIIGGKSVFDKGRGETEKAHLLMIIVRVGATRHSPLFCAFTAHTTVKGETATVPVASLHFNKSF